MAASDGDTVSAVPVGVCHKLMINGFIQNRKKKVAPEKLGSPRTGGPSEGVMKSKMKARAEKTEQQPQQRAADLWPESALHFMFCRTDEHTLMECEGTSSRRCHISHGLTSLNEE